MILNAYIPKRNGEYSEIDLIMIHKTGLYVIELKNYKGKIEGNENRQKWMQSIGKKKYDFYNPIIQNNYHIKYLKEYLVGYSSIPCISIVVFGSDCILENMEILTPNTHLIYMHEIDTTIYSLTSNRPRVLTDEQIEHIFEKLNTTANRTREIKAKHIENIKEKYEPDLLVIYKENEIDKVISDLSRDYELFKDK